jgi:hypothetical protein
VWGQALRLHRRLEPDDRPLQLLFMYDFFQIFIKQFPKMRMAFYQSGNIT